MEKGTGVQLDARTVRHNSYLKNTEPYRKEQDPEKIYALCREMLHHFMESSCQIAGIGLTGQMHGILYLNTEGRAAGNLITWEDERGSLPCRDGKSYSEYLTGLCGVRMATGFGLTTLYYDRENCRVPKEAVSLCTIADYVAMRLCGLKKPVLHASNGASLGMFDVPNSRFCGEALSRVGIDNDFLPQISRGEILLGETKEGVPVAVPIGDNQASFLGTIRGDGKILVNIGTGSQISVLSRETKVSGTMELRPYINNEYLLIGSGLCGGGAYQLLHDFMREILTSFTECDPGKLYQWMESAAEKEYGKMTPLSVDTRFRGTRTKPCLRGSISSIGTDNFTPGNLVLGFLQGICDELYAYFKEIPAEMREQTFITGSGNAIRNNGLLKRMIEDTFSRTLIVPAYKEEAAWGAATLAERLTG